MTSDNDIPWGGELAQLVRELATAAQSVAADDLRLLAKIHGWCERIAQVVEDTGDRNRPELLEVVPNIG